ncbi:hypothetical protein MBM_02362 [Drepanopeziza brunnea f. sp. 'multigermtubi' MB_m1]|uniref:Uncharacterized protein n=1 Tax=Marssonina brunnea f. sp. multigermtubi (strain MB_m1) TaxID=1072389 RepID=K1WN79_MARBU|nr:uncharacterized protein MBM_02362 [Drepanopeziza brunnea f. sp. 'multigermtubi' MB_m1]EKD19125.1 hypothetical protein MBM_02362 [Drepanopeziza brunnea f. sp. 'multigermtubi' MB_m1]
MTCFVRRKFKDALATSAVRLVVKAQLQEAAETSRELESARLPREFPRWCNSNRTNRVSTQAAVSEIDGSQTSSSGLGRTGSGRQQQPAKSRSGSRKY